MSWFDWDPVVPLLAPHRTVVRFDRPGHGLTGPAAARPPPPGEAHRIAGPARRARLWHRARHRRRALDRRVPRRGLRPAPPRTRTAALVLARLVSVEDAPRPPRPPGAPPPARAARPRPRRHRPPRRPGPRSPAARPSRPRTGGGDPAPPRSYAAATRTSTGAARRPPGERPLPSASPPNSSPCARDPPAAAASPPPSSPRTPRARAALGRRQRALARAARRPLRGGRTRRAIWSCWTARTRWPGRCCAAGQRKSLRRRSPQKACDLLVRQVLGQIGLADHADEPLVLDHGQPP